MSEQDQQIASLVDEVNKLTRCVIGLSAVIAALPQAEKTDVEIVRENVDALAAGVKETSIKGTNVAQAMHLAQAILDLARQQSVRKSGAVRV